MSPQSLSWVVLAITFGCAALCFAELATTLLVPGSGERALQATKGHPFPWILRWDLLVVFLAGAALLFQSLAGTLGIPLPVGFRGASWALVALDLSVRIGLLFAFAGFCVGVLVLRKKYPNAERPFRCPGGPVVPILGIVMCLLLMLSLPTSAWAWLAGWLAIGFVIYFAYGRNRRRSPTHPPQADGPG